jgi:hypothetical protein
MAGDNLAHWHDLVTKIVNVRLNAGQMCLDGVLPKMGSSE